MNEINHERIGGEIVETRIKWSRPLNYGDECEHKDLFNAIEEGTSYAALLSERDDLDWQLTEAKEDLDEKRAQLADAQEEIEDLRAQLLRLGAA